MERGAFTYGAGVGDHTIVRQDYLLYDEQT
jgi:hypothetical protein